MTLFPWTLFKSTVSFTCPKGKFTERMNNLVNLSFLDEMFVVRTSLCGVRCTCHVADTWVHYCHCLYIYTGQASILVSVEIVHPGVFLGAFLLTRGKLSHVSLMFQTTTVLLSSTSSRSVGEVAVEDWRRMHLKLKSLIQSNVNCASLLLK